MQVSENINVLSEFLGRRDIDELTREAVKGYTGKEQADVFVLFGGSILEGAEVFARAKKNEVAKKYIIVGGAGHTTPVLRRLAREEYPDLVTERLTEAEIFQEYMFRKYQVQADLLECGSTNCGNNITLLLDLLEEHHISCKTIILCQDATMQLRMSAVMKKYRPDMEVINYASYQIRVTGDDQSLSYDRPLIGMWEMEHYVTLLMGEIPRLHDTSEGYGPKGKNFLAHVDIPQMVMDAFAELKTKYGERVRVANPEFASK